MSSTPRPRTPGVRLLKPSLARLPAYVAALEHGWSPDNIRGRDAALQQLNEVALDPRSFVARLTDREAKGPPVELPDGSKAERIPGYQLWLWDGEFCGVIGFRWQPGTTALPPHVLGHIGYAVVPWKQRRGYATAALRLMLRRVRVEGLRHVEITTDADNTASQKVVVANGGILVEHFRKPPQYGNKEGLRYRIAL